MNTKLNNFTTWIQNEGFYLSPKITIIHTTESNYGVMAKEDIVKDEVLIKIPRKSILCIDNATLKELLVRENIISISKWGSLILCIFHELYLDEESRWFHYLKMFPNFGKHTVPMFWNSDELQLLNHTGVEKDLKKYIDLAKKIYDSCVSPFIEKFPKYFKEGINLDTFKYYLTFVLTYGFTHEEVGVDVDGSDDDSSGVDYEDDTMLYMVPMADVLNHITKYNAKIRNERAEPSMMAVKDIKSGEQIYNDFGPFPNTKLLKQYGFTLSSDDNGDDNVKITPSSSIVDTMWHLPDFVLGRKGFLNSGEIARALQTHLWDGVEYKIPEERDIYIKTMSDYLGNIETLGNVPHSWKSIIESLVRETIGLKRGALDNLPPASDNVKSSSINFVRILLEGHLYLLENALRIL